MKNLLLTLMFCLSFSTFAQGLDVDKELAKKEDKSETVKFMYKNKLWMSAIVLNVGAGLVLGGTHALSEGNYDFGTPDALGNVIAIGLTVVEIGGTIGIVWGVTDLSRSDKIKKGRAFRHAVVAARGQQNNPDVISLDQGFLALADGFHCSVLECSTVRMAGELADFVVAVYEVAYEYKDEDIEDIGVDKILKSFQAREDIAEANVLKAVSLFQNAYLSFQYFY